MVSTSTVPKEKERRVDRFNTTRGQRTKLNIDAWGDVFVQILHSLEYTDLLTLLRSTTPNKEGNGKSSTTKKDTSHFRISYHSDGSAYNTDSFRPMVKLPHRVTKRNCSRLFNLSLRWREIFLNFFSSLFHNSQVSLHIDLTVQRQETTEVAEVSMFNTISMSTTCLVCKLLCWGTVWMLYDFQGGSLKLYMLSLAYSLNEWLVLQWLYERRD